jgi:hypothetical protein
MRGDMRGDMRAWPWARLSFALLLSALILGALASYAPRVAWGQLEWRWLLGAALCSALVWLTRAVRLAVLSGCELTVALKVVATQGALLRVTPLRAGELSLPYLLKRWADVDITKGLTYLLWARLSEVITLLLMALVALYALSRGSSGSLNVTGELTLWLSATLVLTSLGFLALPRLTSLLARRAPRLTWLSERLPPLTARLTLTLATSAALLFGLQLALFGACLAACHLALPLPELTLGASSAHLSGVLPLPTIGNIGSHELGWVVGFMWVGVSREGAALSALVSQVTTLAFALLWWVISAFLSLEQR